MSTQILTVILGILFGGLSLSGMSLYGSLKSGGDKCIGFGFLSFFVFAGTLIAVYAILQRFGGI
jgi:hypothetical protein